MAEQNILEDIPEEVANGPYALQRSQYKDKYAKNKNSFFVAIRSAMIAGQCFALLPVQGITGCDASTLRFQWLSLRTVYSILMSGGSLISAILCFMKMTKDGYSFSNFGEHLLSNVKKIERGWLCSNGGLDLIRSYFVNSYSHVFGFTRYSHWKGVAVLFVNLVATFIWNYVDLFLILVSLSVAQRFRQINALLFRVKGKDLPERFWKKVRSDYNGVAQLTALLDSYLSEIVLLSFGNNLYFIGLQLNNSLRPNRDLLHTLYFYSSLTYLLLRAFSVLLFAASVYDESKVPKKFLQSVPSKSYCKEVEIFLLEVCFGEVAFTGMRLFTINRGLILTVVSIIVSYQVILIQMSESTDHDFISADFNISINCVE
uniref:Gustatory receptor n=1 Tax=Timema douglasi TaxID=61478 RepID=A0A7R8ZCH3_TIMDO|nr:unnamed protein product [Timema douglasi]